MRFLRRTDQTSAVLALLAVPAVHAQGDSNNNNNNNNNNGNSNNNDNNLPDLNSISEEVTQSTASSANTRSSSRTSTATGSTETRSASTATFPDAVTSTSSGAGDLLTGLPTIAGAGAPELVIPFTEAAPFMQRSSMPEGTVFIAVGAVLALFGACVLLWRLMVAWSINRSVKRSAIASIRGGGGEKSSGNTWAPHAASKAAYHKEYETGSSMSLDALNSQGKPLKPFRDDHDAVKRQSSAPVNGLFFSPTAQTANRASSAVYDTNRTSSFLPAGYYASPSADIAGARNSTFGGSSSLAPYSRHSVAVTPSPPDSPNMPASRSTSAYYGAPSVTSRDGLRPHDRQGQSSRDGHAGASSSSLAVGTGGYTKNNEYLGGQRPPSQVFDDMLDVHGHRPRERY